MNSIVVQTIQLFGVITAYIISPLVLFLPLGWWIGQRFDDSRWLFGAIAVAFVVSLVIVTRLLPSTIKRFVSKHQSHGQ
ncbi:MAG: hypothetical protein HYV33_01655 [Candidatus Kerfeldbacteria bacterium]|nr:hypothetical protein [Candidatus Kerfeldbacteria bacterium]